MKNRKITEFIIKTIKGMIVGLGSITAGAGTFAIVLGIYDKCMEIIAKPFKNFKNNIKYIFPIILGIIISVLVFKNIVTSLFINYESYIKCVFFGIILGGLPSLFKVANKKGKSDMYLISLVIAFFITIIVTILGNRFGENNQTDSKMQMIYLFIYGIIYGFGAIMPGMTTMHVLIFLGVWGPILSGIFSLNFNIILPFGIGYLLAVILIANLMSFCFEKFYGYTYYAIIGFSATSLIMLLPNIDTYAERIICPILIIVSTIIMYKIAKLENKIKERESRLYE